MTWLVWSLLASEPGATSKLQVLLRWCNCKPSLRIRASASIAVISTLKLDHPHFDVPGICRVPVCQHCSARADAYRRARRTRLQCRCGVAHGLGVKTQISFRVLSFASPSDLDEPLVHVQAQHFKEHLAGMRDYSACGAGSWMRKYHQLAPKGPKARHFQHKDLRASKKSCRTKCIAM